VKASVETANFFSNCTHWLDNIVNGMVILWLMKYMRVTWHHFA